MHAWNSPGSQDIADIMDDLLDSLLPPARPARQTPRVSLARYLA